MTTQRIAIERPSPFRRRRFVVPHRRRSKTVLLLKPFVTALLLVGVPVAAALWVLNSPRFLLAEVQVGRTIHVTVDDVASALASLEGRHLLDLSLADVESRLIDNPWIEGAAIRKEMPNRLIVQVHERFPVALLRRDDELFYVDRTGFAIGPYDPTGPVDLPLLSVAPTARLDMAAALEVVAHLEQVAPQWSAGLSEVEILGAGSFRIHSAALSFPILVTAEDMESQLSKLDKLLPEITRRFSVIEAVDLRFSRQIVIQPAGEPRIQEG